MLVYLEELRVYSLVTRRRTGPHEHRVHLGVYGYGSSFCATCHPVRLKLVFISVPMIPLFYHRSLEVMFVN